MVTLQDMWKLKQMLDQHYQWPCEYLFKFIIPAVKYDQLTNLLDKNFDIKNVQRRSSSSGKYTSVTAIKKFSSSDDVVMVYEETSKIEGIIML